VYYCTQEISTPKQKRLPFSVNASYLALANTELPVHQNRTRWVSWIFKLALPARSASPQALRETPVPSQMLTYGVCSSSRRSQRRFPPAPKSHRPVRWSRHVGEDTAALASTGREAAKGFSHRNRTSRVRCSTANTARVSLPRLYGPSTSSDQAPHWSQPAARSHRGRTLPLGKGDQLNNQPTPHQPGVTHWR